MIMTDVPFDFVSYLESRFGHASRTPGLHVSQIYGDLDRVLNAARYKGTFTEEDLGAFGTLGFLWERILEDALSQMVTEADPARYWRPTEMECDGILLTPDYADLDFHGDGSAQMGLEEYKVTWKSVKAWDDYEKNFWRWGVQKKAYCYVLGTRFARMRALFLVGNWRDSIVPVCKVREFVYTDRELQENWDMLRNHAKRRGWMKDGEG